jgi:hypothetical protein
MDMKEIKNRAMFAKEKGYVFAKCETYIQAMGNLEAPPGIKPNSIDHLLHCIEMKEAGISHEEKIAILDSLMEHPHEHPTEIETPVEDAPVLEAEPLKEEAPPSTERLASEEPEVLKEETQPSEDTMPSEEDPISEDTVPAVEQDTKVETPKGKQKKAKKSSV